MASLKQGIMKNTIKSDDYWQGYLDALQFVQDFCCLAEFKQRARDKINKVMKEIEDGKSNRHKDQVSDGSK